MRRQGTLALGALLAAAAAAAGCTGTGPTTLTPPGPIQLAVVLPISSPYGATDLKAIQLAVKDRPANLSSVDVRLDVYDDTSAADPLGEDVTLASSDTTAAVANPHDVGLIGALSTRAERSIMPIANNNGLTAITGTASNPGLYLQQYAAGNGIDFGVLHPAGKPDAAFFIGAYDLGSIGPLMVDRFGPWYQCVRKSPADLNWSSNVYAAAYGSAPKVYADLYWDVANVELQALSQIWASGRPVTRASLRDAVASISYSGVTGGIAFDSNGLNADVNYGYVAGCPYS